MLKAENITRNDLIELFKSEGFDSSEMISVIEFLDKNKKVLKSKEYVEIGYIFPRSKMALFSCVQPTIRYTFKIRKSLLVLVALILGVDFETGLESLYLGLDGKINQIIHSIRDDEKCILHDVILGGRKKIEDFDFFEKECVNSYIKCGFREDGLCRRPLYETNAIVKSLVDRETVFVKRGKYRVTL